MSLPHPRIRTIVITLCCSLTICAVVFIGERIRRRARIARIVAAGGTVFFLEDMGSGQRDLAVWFRGTVGVDSRVYVYDVRFNKALLSDRDWETLISFTELAGLTLRGCEVSDERLQSLGVMHRLYHLSLSDTKVTDEPVTTLVAKLPRLGSLDLRGTAVSESCITTLHDQYPNLAIYSDGNCLPPCCWEG